jgi:hypothetical protein
VAADFPKRAVGADVVTKAALVALLLELQFAVWEREDSYFTIAFSIAIRAGRFGGGDAAFVGSGGRREKNRNDDSEKDESTN